MLVFASISAASYPNTSSAKLIFSNVVLSSSNCGSCVTIPSFLLNTGIFHLGSEETSISTTSIMPLVGYISLYKSFKKEDLPLPECPMRYAKSPSFISVEIFDKATLPP